MQQIQDVKSKYFKRWKDHIDQIKKQRQNQIIARVHVNNKNNKILLKAFQMIRDFKEYVYNKKMKKVKAYLFYQKQLLIKSFRCLCLYEVKLKSFQQRLRNGYCRHILRKYFRILRQCRIKDDQINKQNKKIKIQIFKLKLQNQTKIKIFFKWKQIILNTKKLINTISKYCQIQVYALEKQALKLISNHKPSTPFLKSQFSLPFIENLQQKNTLTQITQIQFSRKFKPIKVLPTKRTQKSQTINQHITKTPIKSRNITPIKLKIDNDISQYARQDQKILKDLLVQCEQVQIMDKLIFLKIIEYEVLKDSCFQDEIYIKYRQKLARQIGELI